MHVDDFLRKTVEMKASDLILRVTSPPVVRVNGALHVLTEFPVLMQEELQTIFETVTSPEQRDRFLHDLELDLAYAIAKVGRFRVNVMKQRGTLAFAFRLVPYEIPTIDQLKLPQICKELIMKPRGLILVTGPTGSGKSTTMAAMIDYLNENASKNIITIEDPIEFLHRNKKCLIAQRDLGDDTRSFDIALAHALRQNPDLIVVGEMRDLATISTAIRAAETGHLVMGTLHTTDAPQTVDRIIDIFPPEQQQQIRLMVSQVIEAVLTQTLLPIEFGKGRVAAFEIMVATPAVRNLIRSGKTFELHSIMQLSAKDGMQILDQSLAELVKKRVVTVDEAMLKTSNPDRLTKILQFDSSSKRS